MSRAAKDHAKRYTQAHWGNEPRAIYEFEDHAKGTPARLVEMGKLRELRVRSGNKRLAIRFPKRNGAGEPASILGFATSPDERLYVVLNDSDRARMQPKYTLDDESYYQPIEDVAKDAGGRQARFEDRGVDVQPIGKLTHVIYATDKKGDGPSEYIHKMGEEGGVEPYLCIDADGWLYVVGGSYTVPAPGITQ